MQPGGGLPASLARLSGVRDARERHLKVADRGGRAWAARTVRLHADALVCAHPHAGDSIDGQDIAVHSRKAANRAAIGEAGEPGKGPRECASG